ncbi:MAG: hypothetical protein JXB13_09825 [Phycisphaerae bacterium]|nr:hypothetical protein [Phycisphaerae bacterium]
MSMLTVLIATIALFAIVLFALSIGLIFGKRGLRKGCCGNPDAHTCNEHNNQADSCGTCGPVRSDCQCRSERA